MVLRLYFDKLSQPSRALLLFVRANKSILNCEEIPVALRKREQHGPDFLKINPLRKVPVIVHDDFHLGESVAIMQYLCGTFPLDPHWYPQEPRRKARVDEFLNWQHTTIRTHGFLYFRTKFLKPMQTGEPINQKTLDKVEIRLNHTLDQFETIWLKDRDYVADKEMTIADMLAVAELEQQRLGLFDIRKNRPNLTKYLDRIRERLQPHYDDVNDILIKFEKIMKSGKPIKF